MRHVEKGYTHLEVFHGQGNLLTENQFEEDLVERQIDDAGI